MKKDIELLERVQRRALRIIEEFKGMHYVDMFRKIGLPTRETRRMRGDLIEVFKILRGFENVDKNIFFKSSSTELRRHSEKLYQVRSRLDCRCYDFFQRIVGIWNSLDDGVVS